jgi:hypothetical protein
METSTSAPAKAPAAKPASTMEALRSVEATATTMEASAAETSGVSLIEEEWGPHQICGKNGRYKELET